MAADSTDKNWTKPAAMAIPKEGYFTLEQGRYGRHTRERRPVTASRSSRRSSRARRPKSAPTGSASRTQSPRVRTRSHRCSSITCDGCSFDIGQEKYFMYQGIFDTDFDKYTEDAVQLFKATGVDTIFEKLEGFPTGLEDERAGIHQVRPRAPMSEFSRVRRIPVRLGQPRSRRHSP